MNASTGPAHLQFGLHRPFSLAAVGVLLLSGCTSPVLVSRVNGSDAASPVDGLAYALPKAQVELVVERAEVKEADVKKAEAAAAEAAAATAAAKGRVKEAEESVKALTKLHDVAQEPGKSELVRQLSLQKALVEVLSAAAKLRADDETGARKRAADLAGNAGKCIITGTATFLAAVPDPQSRLVAQWQPALTRDDDLKLGVSNGLLNTVDSTASDQSAQILVSFAKGLAASRAGAFDSKSLSSFSSPMMATDNKSAPTCGAVKWLRRLDPTQKDEREAAACSLNGVFKEELKLEVDGEVVTPSAQTACTPVASKSRPIEPRPGLYYRAPRTVSIRLLPKDAQDSTTPTQIVGAYAQAVVPDSQTLQFLPAIAGTFTKTTHTMVFKDGSPTTYGVIQPSQLAAIARIPIDVAMALVEVPASIIKLRVDYASKSADGLEAQVRRLDAELQLLKAQRALKDEAEKPQ